MDQSHSTAERLARVLFGEQMERVHQPWRGLFSTPPFLHQEGLTSRERAALSYRRLRLVNDVLDPVDFVKDVERLTAFHEWAGPVDPGMATVASIHYNLVLGTLLDHEHDGRDLSQFSELRRVGAFLCTEFSHGNDASHMETTATYDKTTGGFVLTTPRPAAAKFMPNTSGIGGAKTGVVAARLITDGEDQGVCLFVTPLSDDTGAPLPGVHIAPLPQTTTSPLDHCATRFDTVHLPYEALLQADHARLTRDGVFTSTFGNRLKRFLGSIDRVTTGKLCMSAYAVGVMRHALAVAVRHSLSRRTSGMTARTTIPLLALRNHAAPLVEAVATTYAATLLQRTAVQQWSRATEEVEREEGARLAAIAKGWITYEARDVLTTCRERCGAQGLLLANRIAGLQTATEGAITAEGDNLVIWVKAAGETLLRELVPEPSHSLEPAHRDLADPAFLQDLLADVERYWHARAKTRLRAAPPGDPLGRFNAWVLPGVTMVRARAHRLAAEALLAASRAADPGVRHLLTALHRLFALGGIMPHAGILLAQGRVTGTQALMFHDERQAVIESLEPDAATLVDGFAVPEGILTDHPINQPTWIETLFTDLGPL